MAQSKQTSLNEDDIKAMLEMAKDAVHYFAGHRREANCAFFSEPNVDWQLSLTEVPATLMSQPDIKYCSPIDAIFFMRMKEIILNSSEEKLGARIFLAPIMATKTSLQQFPYVLNTWPGMPPHWMTQAPGSAAASSSAPDSETEKLVSYFEACLDKSSMNEMPGLEEDLEVAAAGAGADEMNTAALHEESEDEFD